MGDEEGFTRGLEKARAALGGQARPRPRPVPDPPSAAKPPPAPPTGDDLDERDARIAALEAEVHRLRAALASIRDAARDGLDR